MDVKEMKRAHQAATVCHNWKVDYSPKRPGHLRLEFWEAINQRAAESRAAADAVVSYSTNLSSHYKQGIVDITGYFLYSNELHCTTANGQTYYCSFSARYQPTNPRRASDAQSRRAIDFVVHNSGIRNKSARAGVSIVA